MFSIVSADYDYKLAYCGAGDMPSVSTAGGTKSAKARSLSDPNVDISEESGSAQQTYYSGSKVSGIGTDDRDLFTHFSDDNSFERQYGESEERFECIAPAGKLGVVIDTPYGGVPMVHAIKDTSVLADRVRVKDRLISVDGVDTTEMSAIGVSRLISSRAQNESRVLAFVRFPSQN